MQLHSLQLVHDVDNEGPGDPYYYIVGLITLEDIIELIIQVG
jgi:metal transporter CNNM